MPPERRLSPGEVLHLAERPDQKPGTRRTTARSHGGPRPAVPCTRPKELHRRHHRTLPRNRPRRSPSAEDIECPVGRGTNDDGPRCRTRPSTTSRRRGVGVEPPLPPVPHRRSAPPAPADEGASRLAGGRRQSLRRVNRTQGPQKHGQALTADASHRPPAEPNFTLGDDDD